MYPILAIDPAFADWIAQTKTRCAAFAAEFADELNAAIRDNRFPADIYREFGRRGFLGTFCPTEFGGMGGGVAEYAVVCEEVGRHGLVSGQIAAQGQRWLLDWGTVEQKDRWLSRIAAGDAVFSESISEKGVGSSLKAMKATATQEGSDWVLNGSKTHVNLGADCDVTIFYAMTEVGLTSFLVDMSLPGISAKATEPVGLRMIRTSDVHLVDVRVPHSAVLGSVGAGMETFLSTFNVSRLGNASELIGLGRRALELGVQYASHREVGPNVVTDFQGIQWMMVESWAALQAASLSRDDAVLAYDRGEDISLRTSTAKHLAIVAAEKSSSSSFSLVGGHGLYVDEPYVTISNDIRVLKVGGGSAEVMRNYIARRILKDPLHEGLA